MLGKHDDSCLGAQNAMAPSNSTEPAEHMNKLPDTEAGTKCA